MMRFLQLPLAAFAAVTLVACGGSDKEAAKVGDAEKVEEKGGSAYTIDTDASEVSWKAFKVTGDEHWGKFPLLKGELKVEGEQIVGGNFTMSIKDLTVDDLEGEKQTKLVNHLKAADFFDAENHPEATFEIVEVKAGAEGEKAVEMGATHTVKGNLTVRGKTNSVTFPAKVEMSDANVMAESAFTIDRQLWDVNFQTPDAAIKDDVEIGFKIQAKGGEAAS